MELNNKEETIYDNERPFTGGGSDSRVPVIYTTSYVGTGTYGSSNPTTLTFDFVPEIVIWYRYSYPKLKSNSSDVDLTSLLTYYGNGGYYTSTGFDNLIITADLTTAYQPGQGFFCGNKSYDFSSYDAMGSYAKKSSDGKTIYWYNTLAPQYQCNVKDIQSGGSSTYKAMTYYILAIGYKEES